MLINQVWQPLPGTRQAEIYPYLRKPDLLSSNSCLIRTSEQIILIDTGALAAQTADLFKIIKKCHLERPRPVIIYLTHCHIDHCLQVNAHRQFAFGMHVWIAIQEEGADYLVCGDRGKTIAELYGTSFPSMQPDIRLLTKQDRTRGASRFINIAPGLLMKLTMELIRTERGQAFYKQTVSMGGGDDLDIYQSPGHSPDSICIRIGEILFIGDLLAAANPMVAGISGWNRDHIINTKEQVQMLLETLPISVCYPGHGGIMPASKARDVLRCLQQKTSLLGDVNLMNEERLFQIADYALELIDEAEEVFSSIAGRLLYVAYHLERLEEPQAALRCRNAMQMDQIDDCLLEFRNLCLLLDSKKIIRVEFAHRALRIIEKIKVLFDPRPLAVILPRILVNRANSLILDFISIANGYRNLEEFIPADVNALIEDTLRLWQFSPHLDASVIDEACEREKYLASLVLRIGHEPAANRPVLNFQPLNTIPFVHIAASRFGDTLLAFLDWIKQTKTSSITITTGMDGANPFITMTIDSLCDFSLTPHEEKKIRSFQRRFRMCGLLLKIEDVGFRWTFVDNQK